MGILCRTVSVILLVVLAVSSLHSGEEKDLRAIIAKGIQAKGAEENDAKYKAFAMKGAGTFYGLGEGVPYTGEWHFQGSKQSRHTIDITFMGNTLTFTQIINGDKGWVKFNDEVKDMPKEEVAEEREEMHAKWVTTLLPLKDKTFKLAPLGDVKVGDKAVVGVRVAHAGHRDVNLFFDKTSGMLVKNEYQVKDVKGGGDKEMSQETFFANFKEFKGTKYPTKITIKRDGNAFVEAEISEIRALEMLDDALYAKP